MAGLPVGSWDDFKETEWEKTNTKELRFKGRKGGWRWRGEGVQAVKAIVLEVGGGTAKECMAYWSRRCVHLMPEDKT